MILVLCANAGVDCTYEAPGFAIGGFHHPQRLWRAAGGKGINVARALRALGHEVTVTGFAGGWTGEFIREDLEGLGVAADLVRISGQSRLCINIVDPRAGAQTRLDEQGPEVCPDEVGQLRETWRQLLLGCSVAVISGSAPPHAPVDLYADLVTAARSAGRPVIVDAHDGPLARAVAAAPDLIKPNQRELETLAGRRLQDAADVVGVARELTRAGVGTVVVSMDAAGAIAVSEREGTWRATPPAVTVVNPVGAGDAMVAGLAAAIADGFPCAEQLRLGVAAGTASALALGAAELHPGRLRWVRERVSIERLDPSAEDR